MAWTQTPFERLAEPDGLTVQVSTFARQDVITAVGGLLAGAGRAELEDLADRFCAERAVAVVADRAVEERRWSTPELLAVEQRLVAGAVGRADEQTAVVSHDAVRAALQAHPTAGEDQAAMVRDVCQGGQGVALVVGRAGLRGVGFAVWSARAAREARVLTNAGVDVPAQRPVLLQDRPATAAAGGHRHPRGVAALSDRANIARGW